MSLRAMVEAACNTARPQTFDPCYRLHEPDPLALSEPESTAGVRHSNARSLPTRPSPLVLTVDEVAKMLGCRRTTVYKLLGQGVLARTRRMGRNTTITLESVHRALELPRDAPAPKKRARRTARTAFVQEIETSWVGR